MALQTAALLLRTIITLLVLPRHKNVMSIHAIDHWSVSDYDNGTV